MMQNEAESVIMTHNANLDLVSDVARMALGGNPDYQKLLGLRDERIMATPMPQGQYGGYR
jgi:hypothetical protein